MKYVAHIITRDAEGLDEITVTTRTTDGELAHEIATYPLIAGVEFVEVLTDAGWRVAGPEGKTEAGYVIVDVEPANRESIIRHVAISREHAEMVFRKADNAWRTIVGDAVRNGVPASEIAAIAMVSPEEVEQALVEIAYGVNS